MLSIVKLLLWCLSFPGKVVRVGLLCVPSLGRIEDIITPAHHLACLNSSWECLHFHGHLGVSVTSSTGKKHKRTFVGSPWFKLDDPMFTDVLIHWVIVDVFSLRMIDSCNFWTIDLLIPRIWVDICRSAGANVVFVALVKTDTVNIGADLQVSTVRYNAHTLNGAVKQLWCVGRAARRDCPDVSIKFCSHCFKGLLSDTLWKSCDIFWHII